MKVVAQFWVFLVKKIIKINLLIKPIICSTTLKTKHILNKKTKDKIIIIIFILKIPIDK